jgi:hypothetical protein
MSMKNSNDTIGNRTHDLPACSAVYQPTAPPAACSAFHSAKPQTKYNDLHFTAFSVVISPDIQARYLSSLR